MKEYSNRYDRKPIDSQTDATAIIALSGVYSGGRCVRYFWFPYEEGLFDDVLTPNNNNKATKVYYNSFHVDWLLARAFQKFDEHLELGKTLPGKPLHGDESQALADATEAAKLSAETAKIAAQSTENATEAAKASAETAAYLAHENERLKRRDLAVATNKKKPGRRQVASPPHQRPVVPPSPETPSPPRRRRVPLAPVTPQAAMPTIAITPGTSKRGPSKAILETFENGEDVRVKSTYYRKAYRGKNGFVDLPASSNNSVMVRFPDDENLEDVRIKVDSLIRLCIE